MILYYTSYGMDSGLSENKSVQMMMTATLTVYIVRNSLQIYIWTIFTFPFNRPFIFEIVSIPNIFENI